MSENRDLHGRVALITGSARRVGAGIASGLHAHGASVAVHYRGSANEADALVARFNDERSGSAASFQADLLDTASMPDLVSGVVDWGGRLDILVNNASTFYPTPLGQITEQDWSDLVGSNLKAPLFLSQAAAPAIRAAKGSIVNIVDIHARRPLRDHLVYGAAKAGLAMLTRSLAKDLAPEVRVNGVSPGAILWPEGDMSDESTRCFPTCRACCSNPWSTEPDPPGSRCRSESMRPLRTRRRMKRRRPSRSRPKPSYRTEANNGAVTS